jgi:hypothetical protein
MWPFPARKTRHSRAAGGVPPSRSLRLEALEGRCLPSATVGWAFGTGSLADDAATAVATDRSGDVYVAGYIGRSNSTGNPPPVANLNPGGTTDVGAGLFVARYNPDHSLAWAQGVANAQANAVAVDSSGNVFVTGSFTGTAAFGSTSLSSAGGADVFVAKLDGNGNFLWAVGAGGAGSDSGNGIAVDGAGNAYVTGVFIKQGTFGSITLNPPQGNTDTFVAKLNPSGTVLWAGALYETTGTNGDDHVRGNAIAVDGSGNAYLTGDYTGTVNFNPNGSYLLTSASRAGGFPSQDAFVLKLDTNGNFAWAGSMGGNGSDGGAGIAVDGSGNVYLTGSYGPGSGVHDTDSNNNFNPGSGKGLKLPVGGGDNVFVEKLTTNGQLVWVYGMTGTGGYTGGLALAVDSSGSVYVMGSFTSTLTINSASGKTSLTSQGGTDAFVLKLDTNGKFVSDADLGGTYNDAGFGIAWDPFTGNVYAVGDFAGTASFGSWTLSTAGGVDIYNSQQQDLFIAELTM